MRSQTLIRPTRSIVASRRSSTLSVCVPPKRPGSNSGLVRRAPGLTAATPSTFARSVSSVSPSSGPPLDPQEGPDTSGPSPSPPSGPDGSGEPPSADPHDSDGQGSIAEHLRVYLDKITALSSEEAVTSERDGKAEVEKPKRRKSALSASRDAAKEAEKDKDKDKEKENVKEPSAKERIERPRDTHPLPEDLDVLWDPRFNDPPLSEALPPPTLLQEALNNLLITLHPKTQHGATYNTGTGPIVEPTLSLYCPIEGGDYIIDATVKELARRVGADVVVLDSVQLAAGEWGDFGKAATALQLPHNPLHLSPEPWRNQRSSVPTAAEEEEQDYPQPIMSITPMTFHLVSNSSSRASNPRQVLTASRSSPTSKTRSFFSELVNIPMQTQSFSTPEGEEGAAASTSASTPSRRPRIIYVRDYPTLATSASSWYPHLLSTIRQRRTGALVRQSSPVMNPTTIIFGSTPPLTPLSTRSSSSGGHIGPQGLLGLMMNRQSTTTIPSPSTPSRSVRQDYSEDEGAEKARERRLREKLRKWERGDPALAEELPKLPGGHMGISGAGDAGAGGPGRPEVVVIGPGGLGGMDGFALPSGIPGRPSSGRGEESETIVGPVNFFRSSFLLPASRTQLLEKSCRVSRRREINALTMRMAVGEVGGILLGEPHEDVPVPITRSEVQPQPEASPEVNTSETSTEEKDEKSNPESSSQVVSPALDDASRRWAEWGKNIEPWLKVKTVADQAVGSVLADRAASQASSSSSTSLRHTLEPTPVPWSAISSAWASSLSERKARRTWVQEVSGRPVNKDNRGDREMDEDDEMDGEAGATGKGEGGEDELVQQVKNDPELTPHEQRLLGCIVDSASMPTSFSQVHLPPHTIDSVRTIVSLPLLHPGAFQQGILKQHAMTGCLLFGPPGTGKTLVVRALAKEAGCRMLAVSPSDVMDMYVGEGEKLVKSVFSLARRLSPCVVFLDEIDALFGARMSTRETGGAIAHRGVITEFMQEMDGLKTSKDTNVIVIGATNRPFDMDDAVLRRLPRRLLVDLPGEAEREGILRILLRDEALADTVDLKELAKRTELFSGSDLKHFCVSAALDAVKEKVVVPWDVPRTSPGADALPTTLPASTSDSSAPTLTSADASTATDTSDVSSLKQLEIVRVLQPHNFEKALKEITPSSSESLGSLSALRKWNEEFGEGQVKKKKIMWGKGLFGFSEKERDIVPDGRVSPIPSLTAKIETVSQGLDNLDLSHNCKGSDNTSA